MEPLFINKEKVLSLLPMEECIGVMEQMFLSLAAKRTAQPLRSIMWLPGKHGLLGMMPGYSEELGMMGTKVISVFHANREKGLPSHQGVVILLDAKHGQPLMMFDAQAITAIRTAAASAVATKILASEKATILAMIGSGEQAVKHIEAMLLVRKIKRVNIWSRSEEHANELARQSSAKFNIETVVCSNVKQAVTEAGIICTVTASKEPLVKGEWLAPGTHINAVGSSTPNARELDTAAVTNANLYTDCYESLYKEAGDFLIPKKEGTITENNVRGEIGEVLAGTKKGRDKESDITLFKSLGIAAEDIFSAAHIYNKLHNQAGGQL